MELEKKQLNYGLIDMPPRETDYIAGNGNGVKVPVLLESRNWIPFLSRSEVQHGLYFDTMACVSFSALNCIEAILNLKIKLGLVHEDDLAWLKEKGYFDDNGRVNFSDRFTAKMSGTTEKGNWLYRVGDSVHDDGLVPETVWPYPRDQRTPVFNRSNYYKEIPQAVKDLGKEFLRRFQINYEWIDNPSSFYDNLKYSPIQVTLRAWGEPDKFGVYQYVEGKLNHAVTKVHVEKYRIIEDSYIGASDPGYLKKLADNYTLGYRGMRYIVTNKSPKEKEVEIMTLYKVKDKSTTYQLGVDGLYHPIANEGFVKKLYGNWADIEVIELDLINPLKIGSMIGEFTWFVRLINSLFTNKKTYGKK